MLAVDHVIVTVHDLELAARRHYEQHGLASVAGGRHAGHGTGNRIVPLGTNYIELMAVVDRDEAASSTLGSWVQRRLAEVGEAPGALCLRTDDIEAVAQRTGCNPVPMSRTRPDGVELEWHLVALDATIAEGLPFFIQWHVDDPDHPATCSSSTVATLSVSIGSSSAVIGIDSRHGWDSMSCRFTTSKVDRDPTGWLSASRTAGPSSSADDVRRSRKRVATPPRSSEATASASKSSLLFQ